MQGAGLPMILQDSWTRDPSKPVTSDSGSYTTGACSGSSAQRKKKSHKTSILFHSIHKTIHTVHIFVCLFALFCSWMVAAVYRGWGGGWRITRGKQSAILWVRFLVLWWKGRNSSHVLYFIILFLILILMVEVSNNTVFFKFLANCHAQLH